MNLVKSFWFVHQIIIYYDRPEVFPNNLAYAVSTSYYHRLVVSQKKYLCILSAVIDLNSILYIPTTYPPITTYFFAVVNGPFLYYLER